MAQHARLSASQTKWWATCAGSRAYIEANPGIEGASNVLAKLGTSAHTLVERCLREGSEPKDYRDRLIEVLNPDEENEGTSILPAGASMPADPTRMVFEVNDDMVEAVEAMTGYVRRRCVELGLVADAAWCGEGRVLAERVRDLVERGVVRLEARVVPLPDRDDTGGTADVIIDAWPEIIEAVDYKHGFVVFVPVARNEQLRSYLLGALREVAAEDYERAVYTICQPRHRNSPPDGIQTEETTPGELLDWADWLSGRAEEVDRARAVMLEEGASLDTLYERGLLSTGEDGAHCKWCPMVSGCKAAHDTAQALAGTDFEDEPTAPPPPSDVEGLARIIPWVPFLDGFCKSVMAAGEALLLNGTKVPGQKLVRGRSNRHWRDDMTEEQVEIALLDDFGLDAGSVLVRQEPKLLTGPQAEKLVPKADRKRFNDALLFKPKGKPTMVPQDDPKPELVIEPGEDFDDDSPPWDEEEK